jgi:hypothetical protein
LFDDLYLPHQAGVPAFGIGGGEMDRARDYGIFSPRPRGMPQL